MSSASALTVKPPPRVDEHDAATIPLKIESIRDGAVFAAARTEWGRLLEQSEAGVFNSWEWLYPWYRRIGGDRQLMILTARDSSGQLVGVMPLALSRMRAGGRLIRKLSFLGESHVGSDYLDVIARSDLREAVTRAFARALVSAQPDWDVIDLLDLDGASPTLEMLKEAFFDSRFVLRRSDRYTCPGERFESGERFDAFLKRTGRRDNYLRRRKWLEKQPGFALERVERPGELDSPMADFFRLHAMRWAADGGSQGIKGSGVESFHRDATQYLAEKGWLRIYSLKVGGQAVASVYGLVHRGEFIYFQSGYNPAWRNRSVGLVLVGETFKDTLEGGLRGYDFLRGAEPYKSEWTTGSRRTVALRIHVRGSPGTWLSRQESAARFVRELAKHLLPSAAVEKIRRLRRRRTAVGQT